MNTLRQKKEEKIMIKYKPFKEIKLGLKFLVLACMLVASLSIKKYPKNGLFSIKTTTGSYIAPSPGEVEMPPAKSAKMVACPTCSKIGQRGPGIGGLLLNIKHA